MLSIFYFHISTFRRMLAVPSMAAYCNSLISCFPGTLFRYCLSDFEMVLSALLITDITFNLYIPQTLYLHCKVFIRILGPSQLLF